MKAFDWIRKKNTAPTEPEQPQPQIVLSEKELLKEAEEQQKEEERQRLALEMTEIDRSCAGKDRKHIWAFCSGLQSRDFRGNPKYMFIYICKYRPDIFAYWICDEEELIGKVRGFGFPAYDLNQSETYYLLQKTGVLVSEVVKEYIPNGLEQAVYLNLWHGVGFKSSERRLFDGDIALGIAKRYIANGTFYRDHQLLLMTSPEFEKEFQNDFGVDEDKFIRAGYPRCLYQKYYEPFSSFDHDLRKIKNLPADTKLGVFAPTYRASLGETFVTALPDLPELHRHCEENHLLMIFKVHPRMETEPGFIQAKHMYQDLPYFWFWNNEDDFYEIMGEMDLAIIDYSSIVSDMVAMEIPHYIRYVYDFEEYMADGDLTHGKEKYLNDTLGKICMSFEELLGAIDTYQQTDDSSELRRLQDSLWKSSRGKEDFDNIIQQTLDFQIVKRQYPTLYSFDIFDTLFSRKILEPRGIFYYVRERAEEDGSYPVSLIRNFCQVRQNCENNVRELYRKTEEEREPGHFEITFDEIYDRMQSLYDLTAQQTEQLKKWELEAEEDNVIPLTEQIDLVKQLAAEGNTVVLISDMYLPKDYISKLLHKADPFLNTLPLYVSSEYGVQKTSGRLFFEVYKSFEPYYDFEKWIHYGDNKNADETQPREFGIKTRKIRRPSFKTLQNQLVNKIGTYDAFRVAAIQARIIAASQYKRDEFVASFVSLCMVPYVDWAIRDAIQKGYETLYFISRDGYPLKYIADTIISRGQLPIKTKYIYGSRRAWRIPSFIDEVDADDFYSPRHGNFVSIPSRDKLLHAMDITEEKFLEIFPTIDLDEIDFEIPDMVAPLLDTIRMSRKYNEYLLERAAEERVNVERYFRQEIDPEEKFAFVEYWGRGYTQDNFVRLWHDTMGCEDDIAFYYCRTILPTRGHSIRYNFTSHNTTFFFMEGIFANMPYKSIEGYEEHDGVMVPVTEPIEYEMTLFESMQKILPAFAEQYTDLKIRDYIEFDRQLFEFAMDYYNNNLKDPEFAGQIGSLVDSVAVYGGKREFAPAYTQNTLDLLHDQIIRRNSMGLTTSITMSYVRSNEEVQARYRSMYNIVPGDNVAGGSLLTDEEIDNNKRFMKRLEKLSIRQHRIAECYDLIVSSWDADMAVDEILIVSKGKSIANRGINLFYQKLLEREVAVEVLLMGECTLEPEELAAKLARARYIFIDNPVEQLCDIQFRPETQLILLPENGFRLYNKGFKISKKLKYEERLQRYQNANYISCLQIPSEYQKQELEEYYADHMVDSSIPGGCNITDLYYDPSVREQALSRIRNEFPEAEGKKIILYMPAIRFLNSNHRWAYLIDLKCLQKLLGDEYVVVINFSVEDRKLELDNVLEVPGFSKFLTHPIRELIMAADVIVGDYRDTFFEAALTGKPLYSTAKDYETFMRRQNIADSGKQFEQMLFCPVITSAEELADEIRRGIYDTSGIRAFCEQWFGNCDGHSAERMADYIAEKVRCRN